MEGSEAEGAGSQPTAAAPGSAADELPSAAAYQCTEDKLRAVANRLDRIASAFIDSRRSPLGGAR